MDAARRASELGEALVIASQDNMIVEICRLLTAGADVNYVHIQMHEGKERSTTHPWVKQLAMAMRTL